MYYVYILISEKDDGLYIGKTNNFERRLIEHNSGHTQSLKNRRPLHLFRIIKCKDELEVRKVELEYKKGYKREELKKELSNRRGA